jgi:hypothetical protein
MAKGTAEKTDQALWERVKSEITAGDKGGRAGQWSARKAQLAAKEYQSRGGGYRGPKGKGNHLRQWTDEGWGTRSGAKSRESGERYLPRSAREALSEDEYRRSTSRKRADTSRGKQFSRQPKDVAEKTARQRRPRRGRAGASRAALCGWVPPSCAASCWGRAARSGASAPACAPTR